MANIRLSDPYGLDLSIQPDPASAFGRYFRNLIGFRFRDLNAGDLRDASLANLPVKSLAAGLTVEKQAGPALLEAGAGATLSVSVPTPQDDTLFAGDPFSRPLRIPAGQAYVSLSVTGSSSAGTGQGAGQAAFGFAAGASFALANHRPFPATTTFADALRELARGFALPGDTADLAAMPPGTIATVEGRGSLTFSGQVNLLTAVNPLASLNLPLPEGLPQIQTGGAAEVGASFEVFGEYQVRVEKLDPGRVRLAWTRRHGSEFEVRARARAGLLTGAGGGAGSLAAQVLGGLAAEPSRGDFLAGTGLSDSQREGIEAAVRAGVERRLDLALSFEWGALKEGQSAFLYEVDLAALDDAGRNAVQQALRGDLAGLASALPAGVREVESVLRTLRQSRHSLRVNLLGIYNLQSVAKLTQTGKVLFDPESGDLVISDTATASRLESAQVNFGAQSDRLRKLLADTFLITAAYRAGRLAAGPPELEAAHSYFELHAKTNRQTLKDNLDVAEALGLMTLQEKSAALGERDDFGRTTLFAETRYNAASTEALFLKPDGAPRGVEEYERAGREALQLLIQPVDPDDYRRRPAADDAVWAQMKRLGPFAGARLFPERQRPLIQSDYVLITWWAETMHETAQKLAAVRARFAGGPGPGPGDAGFQKAREELAAHLAKVAADTKPQFGEPWGLVAMDRVGGRSARARVELTGPVAALRLERKG